MTREEEKLKDKAARWLEHERAIKHLEDRKASLQREIDQQKKYRNNLEWDLLNRVGQNIRTLVFEMKSHLGVVIVEYKRGVRFESYSED